MSRFLLYLLIFLSIRKKFVETDKMLIAERIIAINKTENEIGPKLLKVCNLLECAKDVTTIDGCLKNAYLKHSLHPDKIKNAEDPKLAEEAFKVIDLLRKFIKENQNEVNVIFQANSQNSSKPLKDFISFYKDGNILKIDSLKNIKKVKKYLSDENIFEIFAEIENFLNWKNDILLKTKFYQMKGEIKFHRKLFFNKEFEEFLKAIENFGTTHYDQREEKIDALIAMVKGKLNDISWAEFSMVPKAKYEDMAEKKIRVIGEWRENGKAAKSFNETRNALEKQSKNIQTEKSSLKHNPLKELKIIPNIVKIWELHKQNNQIREQIDKEFNNESYLINSPSTRPMYVYKEWQNWESLHYTKEFFAAIEAESNKKHLYSES